MLMIRLQRIGRKNDPSFRVVLTDRQNSTKSGKFLEVLGSYDARHDKSKASFEGEKIKYWMSKGAKLTPTVNNLLIGAKVIEGKKINVLPKRKPVEVKPAESVSPKVADVTPTVADEIPKENTTEEKIEEAPVVVEEVKAEEAPVVEESAPAEVVAEPVAEEAPAEEQKAEEPTA